MNPLQMIQQFNEFKRMFSGDPRQTVMDLMQSGKITQAQLNQAQGAARQFEQILNSYPTPKA